MRKTSILHTLVCTPLAASRWVHNGHDWLTCHFAISVVAVVLANSFACDHKYQEPGAISKATDEQAAQIVAKIVTVYHSMSSYRDTGTVVDYLRSQQRPGLEVTVRFETLFKRPNKLRFNWTVESSRIPGYEQRAMIWSDGTNTWTSYSFRGYKRERKATLDLAVAGATGASLGAAHRIPRLLTDQITGFRLDELGDLRIRGYEPTDGIECVVLVGFRADTELTVWVGRQDHLIRRIKERWKDGTRVETRRSILVNQDIPDSKFSEQGR
jgi:outer membrane lipoprotein-sorting protein